MRRRWLVMAKTAAEYRTDLGIERAFWLRSSAQREADWMNRTCRRWGYQTRVFVVDRRMDRP